MADETVGQDPRTSAREARAEQYFERDLKGQRGWYGERASDVKQRSQRLGLQTRSETVLSDMTVARPAESRPSLL
jgi:hypothetical protein